MKSPVAISRVKSQRGATYDTTRYDSYAADTNKAFSSFYSFCFALAKPEYVRYFLHLNVDAHVTNSRSSRNIDMETACAFWSVLLTPQFPLITDVIEFINVGGRYGYWQSCVDMLYRLRGATKGLTRTCGAWCVMGLTPQHEAYSYCVFATPPHTDARVLQGHAARFVKL